MSQYQRRSRPAPTGPSPEQRIVEGFFRGLWWLICLPFKGANQAGAKKAPHQVSSEKAEELARYWQQVSAHRFEQSTWPLAVSEADKIVDSALKEAGFTGSTFADRLRSAQSYFPSDAYQNLWDAHKLRNSLAHEVGHTVTQAEVNQCLYGFERALNILGVRV